VRYSLQMALKDSHVAAITVALLLLGAVANIVEFLLTAVAIHDIPHFSGGYLNGIVMGLYLYSTSVGLLAAWALCRWVYGVGPLRCLSDYRSRLRGRLHA
jgi:hypothetical protein